MMEYRRHLLACNAHDPAQFRPFRLNGRAVGLIAPPVARALEGCAGWRVAEDAVVLDAPSPGEALATAHRALCEAGLAPPPRGEAYRVVEQWGAPELARVDRAACASFGLLSFGLHVHGVVGDGAAARMWIARRSLDRAIAPGKLDNLVGGGQPAGLSLTENLRKEAFEEASLDAETIRRARPAGAIVYKMDVAASDGTLIGCKRDVLFVYDLALDAGFEPISSDGEAAGFHLWPVDEVLARVRETDEFKFNVPLTLIDWAMRHGWLSPEEPGYVELAQGLRGV